MDLRLCGGLAGQFAFATLQADTPFAALHGRIAPATTVDANVMAHQIVKLWDATAASSVAAVSLILPQPIEKSDEWWNTVALTQPDRGFLNDFRMSRGRFWQVDFEWMCLYSILLVFVCSC